MYTITRSIEIDAAHRVPTHGSKCFNLHGHRYKIEAVLEAQELISKGEQTAMVLDFGFLKEEMMGKIHDLCDHALIWYIEDTMIQSMLDLKGSEMLGILRQGFNPPKQANPESEWVAGRIHRAVVEGHTWETVAVNFIPTAENLAKWWYACLQYPLRDRSGDHASLKEIRVWETPNNVATYSPSP